MLNIPLATAQMLGASEHLQHPTGAGLGAHCSSEGCRGCISSSTVESTSKLQRVSSSPLRGSEQQPRPGEL